MTIIRVHSFGLFSIIILDECIMVMKAYLLQMSRCVTVDFNSLDIIVNVKSWVVVLDFFGISSTQPDLSAKRSPQFTSETAKGVKNVENKNNII